MRTIYFKFHTGYCGEDGNNVIDYPDQVTDEELDQEAYYMAIDHASSYGYDLCDCDDEDCENPHEGNHNIEGSWEVYDPEKHDMLKPGGGKWR